MEKRVKRDFATEEDPRPRRRLSQNFLIDPAIADRIVRAFEPLERDLVLEIGPGRGILTLRVAPLVARFVAVELDGRLIAPLTAKLASIAQASVLEADALSLDWPKLFDGSTSAIRMLSNLPFRISSETVLKLLETPQVANAQLLLQKEFAERLVAKPGTKAYGSLSVLCQAQAEVELLFTVGARAFRPSPRVNSALVRFAFKRDAHVTALWTRLKSLTRAGFAARRKRLDKALSIGLGLERGQARELIQAASIDPSLRPDAIPPACWLELARRL